jgi:hypothetical protein
MVSLRQCIGSSRVAPNTPVFVGTKANRVPGIPQWMHGEDLTNDLVRWSSSALHEIFRCFDVLCGILCSIPIG